MSSISQFLLDTSEQHRQEYRIRNKWMIRLRWLYIILLPGITIAATLLAGESRRLIPLYLMLMAIGLTLNGLLWLATTAKAASVRYYQVAALLQITLDLCLASAAIYAQGGIASRATVLYALPIVMSGVLFRQPAAQIAAVLSGAAYAGTIYAYASFHPGSDLRAVIVPATFYPCMFLLLAAVTTRFSAINARDEQEHTYKQLLAMLHHQLHHPSSVIAAITEMLEHGEHYHTWPAKDKEYLQQLGRENLRLNTMITNVLESASKPKDGQLTNTKPVDIMALINETATSCAIGAKRIGDLKTKLPHQKITIHAQPQQLSTAFDNVIENAFRYSQPGTPVTVSLTYDQPKGHITITVEDKGQGMSADDQSRLFHLFTKLEERSGGPLDQREELYSLGLGLYVSKVIIERHHGRLEIQSRAGEGTKVTIKIREELWRRPEFYT